MKWVIGSSVVGLFLFVTCCSHDSHPPVYNLWQKLDAPYLGEPFDIKFTSADTGYILGAKYGDDSIYNILIKTIDGGKTWNSISYKDHRFLTDTTGGVMSVIYVSPFDSDILFSGCQNLTRTTDGGYHWQKVDTMNRIGTPNMHFFDPANGVCVGGGFACKTTDSGYNWVPTFHPPTGINFELLQFTSRQTGYLSGGSQADGGAGGMMGKTTDGGNTWKLIDYPFDDVVSTYFVSDNIGYVSMLTAYGNIAQSYLGSKFMKTVDGGQSWIILRQTTNDGGNAYFNLYFKTEDEGFCINNGILHTLDGGNTWQRESDVRMDLLCFPDAHTGYAVDYNGGVYKRQF